MANIIYNLLTLYGDSNDIKKFLRFFKARKKTLENFYELCLETQNDEQLIFKFCSRWISPITTIKKFAKKYKSFIFRLEFTSFDTREYGVFEIKGTQILQNFKGNYIKGDILLVIYKNPYLKSEISSKFNSSYDLANYIRLCNKIGLEIKLLEVRKTTWEEIRKNE